MNEEVKKWKRYQKYKDSGVEWLGEIPAHWEVQPLRGILEQRIEYNTGRKTENILSVIKDVGVINYEDREASGNKKSENIEQYKIIYPNDIVVNRMNLIFGSVGIASEYGASSTEYYVLKPKNRNISNPYYSYIFCNKSFQSSLVGIGKGILFHRMRIYSEELKKILFPLPPFSEQRSLASFLDRETAKIDTLIAKKERFIELLQEKRTALISHAVTTGLNPDVPMKDSGIEWLDKIPAHWEIKRIKRCLQSWDYGISDNIKGEGTFKVLTMGHIQDGQVLIPEQGSLENVSQEFILEKGDLLFNRTNSLELVGKVGLFQGTKEDKVSFASYLVRLKPNKFVGSIYLNFLLNSHLLLSKARQRALPSLNQANLNPTKYCQIRIPLPPVEEQKEITSFIDRKTSQIDSLISKTRTSIDLLKEYKTALISAAVTGKIDVREEVN